MGSLSKIEHVVVLMMENRSFDHMLGYLKLKHGLAVDGLTGNETNPDLTGQPVTVNSLSSTLFPTDVGHSSADVREQVRGNNQGFVRNYLHQKEHGAGSLVMGYHDEAHVWAYDQIAKSYAVCDRWFAPLPGPTIPNRLFAVAGQSGGDTDQPGFGVKFYDGVKSIFDCLDAALADRKKDDRWCYYYHDVPMLGLLSQHTDEFFPLVSAHRIRKIDDFFQRAAAGSLPAVSWIDPNFADIGKSNDDHPPKSDLYDGQKLVASVYHALLDGGRDLWSKTLFILAYDEHGGFHDHVSPPATGDAAPFDSYGLRVPAFVMSAWIPQAVDSVVRDHTSILATILRRFAPGQTLTPRVGRATDLDGLLSLATPRADRPRIKIPPRPAVAKGFAAARATALRKAPPTGLDLLLSAYQAELKRRGALMARPGPKKQSAARARTRMKGKARAPHRSGRRPKRPSDSASSKSRSIGRR